MKATTKMLESTRTVACNEQTIDVNEFGNIDNDHSPLVLTYKNDSDINNSVVASSFDRDITSSPILPQDFLTDSISDGN